MQGNRITQQFLNLRAQLDDRQVLPATIAFQAAPVYSGLKPSTIINLGRPGSTLAQLWAKLRKDADHFKGLSSVVFCGVGGNLQLFCWDAGQINRIIADDGTRAYLEDLGYRHNLCMEDCIAVLQKGFSGGCPHEIGIFLGYPLPDVKAFVRNKGRNYLMNGYWKVYTDVSYAVRMFQAFDHAKRNMLKEWKSVIQ